jgi:hypothetical protein
MKVICDSSILINLSLVGQLNLLEKMFGEVFIPPGVYDEVVKVGSGRVGAEKVRDSSFIRVLPLRGPDQIELFIKPLSQVDAEVIILAKEQKADLVLARDRALNRRANREGLRVASLFDLFLFAKQRGFLQAVKPLLDKMKSEGVLIREGVYQDILHRAGEQ